MLKVIINASGHYLLAASNKALTFGEVIAQAGGTTGITLVDFVSKWPTTAHPVVQRKAGTNYADVPVLYTYTGAAPTNPQARVIRATDGGVVKDWTTLASQSNDGAGNGLGTLTGVPMGARYLLQIRDGTQPGNSATTSFGTQKWGVGVIWLCMGQSNMIGTFTGGSFDNVIPGVGQTEFDYYNAGNVTGAVFDNVGFHAPSNNDSASPYYTGPIGTSGVGGLCGGVYRFMRIISKALLAKYGYEVPVAVIPWAFNSTSIASYFPNGDKFSAFLNGSGVALNAVGFNSYIQHPNVYAGDFEGFSWYQGEGDQDTNTQSGYKSNLGTLYTGLLNYVSMFGRTADNLPFHICTVGNVDPGSAPKMENIRAAIFDFVADAPNNGWNKVQIGWQTLDLKRRFQSGNSGPLDGLHFDDTSGCQTRSMRRMIQSVLYSLGCATFSGRGPQVNAAGITRNGLVATIPIIHEGGTSLVVPTPGNPITGWYANTSIDANGHFNGSYVPMTMAIASNSVLTATFQNGQVFPVHIKNLGGKPGETIVDANGYTPSCYPDISNIVYDNSSYPSTVNASEKEAMGLPLLATPRAITIN